MSRRGRDMLPYCIVCGATDWSVVKHAIPTCPERRAKWLSILGIDPKTVKTRSRVCERHFSKDQYIRTNLSRNAIPKPSTEKCFQGPEPSAKRSNTVVIRNPRIESKKDGNIWQDKINLNGRCLFCLEMLPNSQPTPPPVSNAQWTSLAHLWPYLQANGPPTKNNSLDFYLGKRDNDGELIFSQIPPMCPSCLHNVDTLNTLHHQLEALRAKLIEQEKLVKAAAGIICDTVAQSVKPRRNVLQKELAASRISIPCVLNTTHFLDSLLGNPLKEYESTKALPIPIAPQAIPPPQNPQVIVLTPVSSLLTNCTSNLNSLNKIPIPALPKHCTPKVVLREQPSTVKILSQKKSEASGVIDPECVSVKTEPLEDEIMFHEQPESSEATTLDTGTFPNRGIKKFIKPSTTTGPRSCRPEKRRKISGDTFSDVSSEVKHPSSLSDDEELIDVPASQDSNFNADADYNEATSFDDPLAGT